MRVPGEADAAFVAGLMSEYAPERVPEFAVVAAYGGRTALVGDPKDHATSDLIQKVRALPLADAKTAVY